MNAFVHSPDLGNTRSYMGGPLTIPVKGEHTRGRFAVAAMSAPAASLCLPEAGSAPTYTTEAAASHAVGVAAELGTRFLTPQETRDMMPDYPGNPHPIRTAP